MLYADDYVSPRRGFRDPLRMTQNAHVCSEFRSSGETKTFKPFKPLVLPPPRFRSGIGMWVSARSAHARSAARSALRRVAAPYGVAKTRLRRPIYVENGPLRGLGGRATRAWARAYARSTRYAREYGILPWVVIYETRPWWVDGRCFISEHLNDARKGGGSPATFLLPGPGSPALTRLRPPLAGSTRSFAPQLGSRGRLCL